MQRPYRLIARLCVAFIAIAASASAQSPRPITALPESVVAALKTANVPPTAVGISVLPLNAGGLSRPSNDNQPMNPASTMKLVTTLAGLELLGPQYVWRTEALATAPIKGGVLDGDLYLRGSGDPRLGIEHLWLLAPRLRGIGLVEIRGDVVLDRTAFELIVHDAGAFDGEQLRPYNAGPDALLLNFKSVSFHFVPDVDTREVRVFAVPRLAGMTWPSTGGA